MSRNLLIVITAFALHVDVQAQDDFYIANGRQVPLVQSESAIAVRLQAGEDRQFGEFVDDFSALQIENLPALQEEHGIVFLRVDEQASEQAVDDAFERIRGSPLVQAEVPAFRSGAIDLLFIGRFRIRFVQNVSAPDIDDLLRDIGARILSDEDRDSGRFIIDFPGRTFDESLRLINDLNDEQIVRYSQPDFIRVYPPRLSPAQSRRRPPAGFALPRQYSAAAGAVCSPTGTSSTNPAMPDDPLFENQWSLRNLGNNPLPGIAGADIEYVPALPFVQVPGIKIAVIDLGVEGNHPDLQANMYSNFDATGDGDARPQHPSNFHGTAVAGIAAATHDNSKGLTGVAAQAGIINVRIAEAACEDCSWVTINGSEWRGIRAAVKHGAHVLVNSWGVWGGGEDSDIYAEIKDAIDRGRVVIFAAGNHLWFLEPDGMGGLQIHPGYNSVEFPASLAVTAPDISVRTGLIAVSATNQYDEFKTHPHEMATMASNDDDTGWGSNRGPAVSLAAPGVRLYTTDNGAIYRCFSGTSASAPLVGGAAAILLREFPGATPAQIKRWLQLGADKLYLIGGPNVRDDFIGHGRLDLMGAITAATQELTSDEVPVPNAPQDLHSETH